MSGGYSKKEVIENIRKTRSLNELGYIATAPRSQVNKYAIEEAKKEIKRRMTGRRIKPKKSINKLGIPNEADMRRMLGI